VSTDPEQPMPLAIL